jgi:hypothetical protein
MPTSSELPEFALPEENRMSSSIASENDEAVLSTLQDDRLAQGS